MIDVLLILLALVVGGVALVIAGFIIHLFGCLIYKIFPGIDADNGDRIPFLLGLLVIMLLGIMLVIGCGILIAFGMG
jgi:hypothetical protein